MSHLFAYRFTKYFSVHCQIRFGFRRICSLYILICVHFQAPLASYFTSRVWMLSSTLLWLLIACNYTRLEIERGKKLIANFTRSTHRCFSKIATLRIALRCKYISSARGCLCQRISRYSPGLNAALDEINLEDLTVTTNMYTRTLILARLPFGSTTSHFQRSLRHWLP